MIHYLSNRILLLWLLVPVALAPASKAQAQIVGIRYRPYSWGYYSPYDAITSRVYAQAELLRAGGAASVDYAVARRIRAEAVRQEIANSVERVKAHWERKTIGEAEVLKRHRRPLRSRKLRNSRTWDRLKNHPEFNGPGITNGRLLNFLLHRLSGTVLVYDFSRPDDVDDAQLRQDLALARDIVHGLQLKQRGTNGRELVFRADEGVGLQLDYWPFALRDPYFNHARKTLEEARQQVALEAGTGSISSHSVQQLDEALLNLRNAFDEYYSHSRRFENGMRSWHSFNAGWLFLNSLVGEVGQLKATGRSDAFDGSRKFAGENLIDLLQFMSRNGLEFAPAQPGDEQAYFALSSMMREVYALVADDADALQFDGANPANLPRAQQARQD